MLDWSSLFLIFGSIILVLSLIQIARVVKARHYGNNTQERSTAVNIIFPTETTALQLQPYQRDSTLLTETWIFAITPPLIDRITAGSEHELHFLQTCSIQSVKPFPTDRENSYFEIKILELPPTTTLILGLSPQDTSHNVTPGKDKTSIGLESRDGLLLTSSFSHEYGSTVLPGDVIGCGFRPHSDRVFYTRNGRRYPRVVFETASVPVYPTIQANGPCIIEYNFGQRGFVLTTANSRGYGLASPNQLVVPPPSYSHHSMDLSICSSRDSNSFLGSDSYSTQPLSPHSPVFPTLQPPPYTHSSHPHRTTLVPRQS